MLFALPPSLLLLISTAAFTAAGQQHPHPRELDPDFKYFPEYEHILRRDLAIRRKLQWQMPIGVQKMGVDPGEKFYLDYWIFDPEPAFSHNASQQAQLGGCMRAHLGPSDSVNNEAQNREARTPVPIDLIVAARAARRVRPYRMLATGTLGVVQPARHAGRYWVTALTDRMDATVGDVAGMGMLAFKISTSAPPVAIGTTTVTSYTTITPSNSVPTVVATTIVVINTITATLPDPGTTTETARSTATTTVCPDQPAVSSELWPPTARSAQQRYIKHQFWNGVRDESSTWRVSDGILRVQGFPSGWLLPD
ncbi:uncharacterized protein AB675_3200 [Cyphellophora attinorum]|uniref:Uncharacterized protein n=1 Tax=Cyphellophora attinorum TaxID=1664694 RepID=A0A0N1H816_9EURO|nr:uncharacterized protein AB675_3200 [Phialophora attinorum]KPI37933.1 hypothetical protein AB675_3200 [Phialophora attinorum]